VRAIEHHREQRVGQRGQSNTLHGHVSVFHTATSQRDEIAINEHGKTKIWRVNETGFFHAHQILAIGLPHYTSIHITCVTTKRIVTRGCQTRKCCTFHIEIVPSATNVATVQNKRNAIVSTSAPSKTANIIANLELTSAL
jgi:hypothetical protein